MDYQIVCVLQLVLALLCTFLDSAKAIVGRDLLLTPRRGLQLNGRSIYYEEDGTATVRNNQTTRPWERALKHVTYVTLFTNAAAEAAPGNISKVHAYTDFIHSPYISRNIEYDARFGDIVTLASGRLEQSGNKTFRFVEGQCDYACDAERVWALWQVQKIRHRDTSRKFRYEMKFSVSPVHVGGVGNTKRKAELKAPNQHRNALQTYIQRDDDYPKTFGRIVYADDASFADRRLDDYTGRNFRQPPSAAMQDYRQATPMPQSTFMHGIFRMPLPPHYPPMPQKLNIGEYIKDYTAKATPKIELFPSILNTISRSHFPTPTTFRPNYQVKFPRPEIYQPPPVMQHDLVKFPDHSQERFTSGAGKLTTPTVMHHFHHHFYMPSSTSVENSAGSGEQQQLPHTANEISEVTPSYLNNYYNEQTTRQRPFAHTTHKHAFATPHRQQQYQQQQDYHQPEVHEQLLVHVTPVPPLRKPQIYQMYPVQLSAKVPLIYPAPVEEDEQPASPTPPSRHKPFIRSEPIDVEPVRYSEPDPLYLNLAHNPQTDEHSYELSAPQLEAPKPAHNAQEQYRGSRPDLIAAQLPPPDKDQDVRIPYVDEIQEASNKAKHDLEHNSSQKKLRISTAETPTTEAATETAPSATTMPATTSASLTLKTIATTTATTTTTVKPHITATAKRHTNTSTDTPTTNTLHSATTAAPVTMAIETATKGIKQHFVSTSTSETPLRAVSRHRVKYTHPTSTSTEQPVLKWKPRRKHTTTNSKLPQTQSSDQKAKNSLRHEKKLPAVMSSAEPLPKPQAAAGNETALPPQSTNEVYEVLTQKSVSKSVSIKVGSNGEEIPVIIDDNNTDADEGGETHDDTEQQKPENNEVKSAL